MYLALALAFLFGTFQGKDGATIAYRVESRAKEAPDRGAIVLLPGYTESYLGYDEPIAKLAAAGYDVYAMDHRGMGKSSRLTPNPQVVHVERFDDYVDDAAHFVQAVVRPRHAGKLYLFAHSTGGLIGVRLLAREPGTFTAAVLSAPLLSLDTGWLPRIVARGVVAAACGLGFGASYAPGFADVDIARYTFEVNTTTHSRERFAAQKAVWTAHPGLVQGGPSHQWLREVFAATADVEGLAEKARIPLLLLQAGEDSFVSPSGQDAFCAAAPRCKKVVFPGARHEIFREIDEIHAAFMQEMLGFLASH